METQTTTSVLDDVINMIVRFADRETIRRIANEFKHNHKRYHSGYTVSGHTIGFVSPEYAHTWSRLMHAATGRAYNLNFSDADYGGEYSQLAAVSALIECIYRAAPDTIGKISTEFAEYGCAPWGNSDARHIVCDIACCMFPIRKFHDHSQAQVFAMLMNVDTKAKFGVYVHE